MDTQAATVKEETANKADVLQQTRLRGFVKLKPPLGQSMHQIEALGKKAQN